MTGAATDGPRRVRVLCLTRQPATAAALQSALVLWLPAVEIVREVPGAHRGVPAADCVVAEPEPTGRAALHLLRELRAAGYPGGVVLLAAPAEGTAGWDAEEAREATQLGAALRDGAVGGEALAEAVVEQVALADGEGDVPWAGPVPDLRAGLRAELHRTRQQLAAGALALRLQHSLNNPLAALLAEAQLLEMEELVPEHRAAIRRIIELCRRTVGVVRELSVVRSPAPPPAARAPSPAASTPVRRV